MDGARSRNIQTTGRAPHGANRPKWNNETPERQTEAVSTKIPGVSSAQPRHKVQVRHLPCAPLPRPHTFLISWNILFPLEEAVRTYTSANQAGNVRASTALCSFLVLYDWCILQLFWVTMANLISQNSFMMCYYSQESICKTE